MKYTTIIAAIFLFSCTGSLSDEQRKQIKDGMEMQKIVKISDAEIIAEGLQKGKRVLADLEKSSYRSDSVGRIHGVQITFIEPGKSNARQVEQELIEAYINGMVTGNTQENIQKIWTDASKQEYDTLLYTSPRIKTRSDGTEELLGIWNIYIPQKSVVIDITRRKK